MKAIVRNNVDEHGSWQFGAELDKVYCARCGEPVDLENLHPDSFSVPEDGFKWYAVHVDCAGDFRGWVVEILP